MNSHSRLHTPFLLAAIVCAAAAPALRFAPAETPGAQRGPRAAMARARHATNKRSAWPAAPKPLARSAPMIPQALAGGAPQDSLRQAYELPCAAAPDTFLEELEKVRARDGRITDYTHLLLTPGDYYLLPRAFVDSTCGNCEDPAVAVEATMGLVVSGRGIVIEGSPEKPESVVIHTGAGYGILFEDCRDCVLRGLTVTGGLRDPDARATDAAVVVRDGSVRIESCVIRDNIGDSTVVAETVVGVVGIVGREGASIAVSGCRIVRNSWDGIALYRGANAVITGSTIDGVDAAHGKEIGGGRGVGIGVTWDATARIEGNLVRRYWKGIGVFVDARCDVMENVIEDVLTWGIAYWDAGNGRPVARIERNLIYHTGACGVTIAREAGGDPAPGDCVENIIVQSGLNPKYDEPVTYCAQCPISVEALPDGFTIDRNTFFYNRRVQCGTFLDDLTREEFFRDASPLLDALSRRPPLGEARAFGELARVREGGN